MQTSIFVTPGSRAHFDAMMAHNARALRGEVQLPPQTPLSVAWHEACHAVATIRLGGEFDEVVTIPRRTTSARNPISLGHVRVRFRHAYAIRPVTTTWAGAVGDGHVFAAGADLDWIAKVTGGIESKMSLDGFRAAALIVQRYRPAIDAVAARLVEIGRLGYAEVVEIVGSAAPSTLGAPSGS